MKNEEKTVPGTYTEEIGNAAELLRETARRAPREIWKATIAAPTSVLDYFKVVGPETLLAIAGLLECFDPETEEVHDECPSDQCEVAAMLTLARRINGSLA